MPFVRQTPRRLSRHWITLSDLNKANAKVVGEMANLGFWHRRLEDIEVYLVPVSFRCYGWFWPQGHILIPAVNGASLKDLIAGQHTRLTDVLRHEWAHALAHRRNRLVESKALREIGWNLFVPCAFSLFGDPASLCPDWMPPASS